jgi:hypothetical protein
MAEDVIHFFISWDKAPALQDWHTQPVHYTRPVFALAHPQLAPHLPKG